MAGLPRVEVSVDAVAAAEVVVAVVEPACADAGVPDAGVWAFKPGPPLLVALSGVGAGASDRTGALASSEAHRLRLRSCNAGVCQVEAGVEGGRGTTNSVNRPNS